MKNALILHGTSGSSHGNWFPWLKKQLEAEGYTVWVPDLPQADYPNTKRYNEYLIGHNFNKKQFDFNEETIIIGHSSGAVAALGLLQELPGKVKAVYLIGVFKDNLNWRDDDKKLVLEGLFETPLDLKKLRTKAGKYIIIHSTDDPYCPHSHATYFAVQLEGELHMHTGEKHFSTETMGDTYKEFPMLLDMMKKN